MDRLIETLREEQLVKVILLLDDGKRHEAVQYLRTDSHLTEAEAQQLIDELIRQHGLAMDASKGECAPKPIDDISTPYFDTEDPPRPQLHTEAQAPVETAANGIEDLNRNNHRLNIGILVLIGVVILIALLWWVF